MGGKGEVGEYEAELGRHGKRKSDLVHITLKLLIGRIITSPSPVVDSLDAYACMHAYRVSRIIRGTNDGCMQMCTCNYPRLEVYPS